MSRALEKSDDRLFRLLQFLHMREEPAGFDSVFKTAGNTAPPFPERRRFGQPIKRVVDFNRVETLRVVLEPLAL